MFLRYFVLLLILVLVLLFFWISLGGSFLLVSRVLCWWVQVAVVGGPVSGRLCSEEGWLHSVCNWLNVSTIDSTWAPEQVTWLWACSPAVCFTLFLSNYFLEVQLYPKLGFFLRPWQPCQVFLLPLYVDYTLLLKCSSCASKVQFWGQNSCFAFLLSLMNLFCHTIVFSIISREWASLPFHILRPPHPYCNICSN